MDQDNSMRTKVGGRGPGQPLTQGARNSFKTRISPPRDLGGYELKATLLSQRNGTLIQIEPITFHLRDQN